ncbi:MAG: hypothetical protein E7575_02960 [Ruminococcaceae bacterium]|nr:hypothetical protein [Oscillospiraceae bacterium]
MLLKFFNLQLFADAEGASGAAPSSGAGGQAAADTGATAPAMQSNAADTAAQGADTGTGGGMQGERLPWEQVRELYREEIDADAKEYAKRYSKDAVAKRTAKLKAQNEEFEALKPYLDRELYRHGLKPGDYKALKEKGDADRSLFRERAMANGTTEEVEEALYNARREVEDTKAENERLKAAEAEERELNEIRKQYKQVAGDVQSIREQFDPAFDLKAEMAQNKLFARYASEPHFTILEAYKLAHHDDIVANATAKAAEDAVAKTTNAIRSGSANAPREAAVSAGSPAEVKVDPSRLSKKEIDDYIAQATRGIPITFR